MKIILQSAGTLQHSWALAPASEKPGYLLLVTIFKITGKGNGESGRLDYGRCSLAGREINHTADRLRLPGESKSPLIPLFKAVCLRMQYLIIYAA